MRADTQHRALTRPYFHPDHVSPALFTPHILASLAHFPTVDASDPSKQSEAFDIQKAMGDLALHMAVDWLCGVRLDETHSRGTEWEAARAGVGEALRQAQGAVGRRMKIGNMWVSVYLEGSKLTLKRSADV
jgi:hypothetical protein